MSVIDFKYIAALKGKLRKGWTYEACIPPEAIESVADHSYGTAMLCMTHCPEKLDSQRAFLMALAHDFAEAVVPDYTPHDKIAPEEKSRQEREVFEKAGQPDLLALWIEYDAQKTPLAKFVYAMDKLECLLQAHEYWKSYGLDLANWLPSLFDKIPAEFVDASFPEGQIGGYRIEQLRENGGKSICKR